jgi:amidase
MAHSDNPKSLCGLPIAIKDYNDLGGALTTYGSPIFSKNFVKKSDATVRQLETNGAIGIAKSNVPEWAGGHTFNPVNGITRNPWDLRKSAGGSSGGSSAAELLAYVQVQAVYLAARDYHLWTRSGWKDQWHEILTTWP